MLLHGGAALARHALALAWYEVGAGLRGDFARPPAAALPPPDPPQPVQGAGAWAGLGDEEWRRQRQRAEAEAALSKGLSYLAHDHLSYLALLTRHLPRLLDSVRGALALAEGERQGSGKKARTVYDHGFRAADNGAAPAAPLPTLSCPALPCPAPAPAPAPTDVTASTSTGAGTSGRSRRPVMAAFIASTLWVAAAGGKG